MDFPFFITLSTYAQTAFKYGDIGNEDERSAHTTIHHSSITHPGLIAWELPSIVLWHLLSP